MTAEFLSQLGAAIHGRYKVDGSSFIYLSPEHSVRRRQGIELHEWVHSELLDNTTYGKFQRMLGLVTRQVSAGAFKLRCEKVLASSMRACSVLHEGLGAYRELCWLASNEGNDSAEEYLASLPDFYREGVERVTRLIGNPLDDPYQGLAAQCFHTLLVTFGIAVMNSPVLTEYADPERIHDDPLTWILLDGPDQRFAALDEHEAVISSLLASLAHEPLLTNAVGRFIASNDPSELVSFWDLGVETLRGALPDMPMLTRAEVNEQTKSFDDNWSAKLQALVDVQVLSGEPNRDTSPERSLAMRVYPSSYEHHESVKAQEDARPVYLDRLVDAIHSLRSPNLVYLATVTTMDFDSPRETILEEPAYVMAVPMWAASSGDESPWASFSATYMAETTIGQIVELSSKLAQSEWCWYTNQMIVLYLRELDRLPQGLIFERCSNAKGVLDELALVRLRGAEANGFYIKVFRENESLVAIVFDDLLSFSIATDLGRISFVNAATDAGLRNLSDYTLHIGARDVALDIAARWLRWSALGS